MKEYKVYYEGKDTGLTVSRKSISILELKKVVPYAVPWGDIKFKITKL